MFAGTLASAPGAGHGSSMSVAAKVPAPHAQEEFDEELKIMATLVRHGGHPNIIGVLGCVRTGANKEPPMLVLELCVRGDLKAFLAAAMQSSTTVMPGALLRFGREVAQALHFLEARNILHRDIAARNVLLTEDTTCKLADFGLARNVVKKEYYRLTAASAPIPVRWMAPEVLSHGMCSPAGERWSFGVLLWEIYSLGGQPCVGYHCTPPPPAAPSFLGSNDSCSDTFMAIVLGQHTACPVRQLTAPWTEPPG